MTLQLFLLTTRGEMNTEKQMFSFRIFYSVQAGACRFNTDEAVMATDKVNAVCRFLAMLNPGWEVRIRTVFNGTL